MYHNWEAPTQSNLQSTHILHTHRESTDNACELLSSPHHICELPKISSLGYSTTNQIFSMYEPATLKLHNCHHGLLSLERYWRSSWPCFDSFKVFHRDDTIKTFCQDHFVVWNIKLHPICAINLGHISGSSSQKKKENRKRGPFISSR